jgi:hypothetical protein
VLEGCGKMDEKCYKDTREVLRSADLEIDQKIERRAFRHMLSKTVKSGVTAFLDFASMLHMSWDLKFKDRHGELDSIYIPTGKAGEADKLRTATEVVVSAEKTAVVTIKPTPDPTGVKGCVANT